MGSIFDGVIMGLLNFGTKVHIAGGPGQYSTVATALGVASSGDTVLVLPGTHAESNLTLPAGVNLIGLGSASKIEADGGNNSILKYEGNNQIENLRIRNTSATDAQPNNAIMADGGIGETIIRNCHLYAKAGYPLTSVGAYGRVVCQASHLEGPKGGAYVGGGSDVIQGCYVRAYQDDPLSCPGSMGFLMAGSGRVALVGNRVDLVRMSGAKDPGGEYIQYVRLDSNGSTSDLGTLDGAPVYDGTSFSTITATADIFYANMVGESLDVLTGAPAGAYTVEKWISPTQVLVQGDASAEDDAATFSIPQVGRLDSIGNSVRMMAHDDDAACFRFYDNQDKNHTVYSVGDHFEITSSGTIYRVDNLGAQVNTVNWFGGNAHQWATNGANLTETSNVQLDVAKVGFFGSTPTVQSGSWQLSNRTADKILDCDGDAVAAVADVLGTVIAELGLKGLISVSES